MIVFREPLLVEVLEDALQVLRDCRTARRPGIRSLCLISTGRSVSEPSFCSQRSLPLVVAGDLIAVLVPDPAPGILAVELLLSCRVRVVRYS